MGWIKTKVGLRTRLIRRRSGYKDNVKQIDNVKQHANVLLCKKTANLQRYWRSVTSDGLLPDMRYLVLDSLHLGTTTHLVEKCGVKLRDIDICSDGIEFDRQGYTGKLSTFLAKSSKTYDVVYFDFCGLLTTEENMLSVERLFSRGMLETASVFAITFATRSSKKIGYFHENTFGAFIKVQQIAMKYGYHFGDTETVHNKKVSTYLSRCIHVKDALKKNGGINLDEQGRSPDRWVLGEF